MTLWQLARAAPLYTGRRGSREKGWSLPSTHPLSIQHGTGRSFSIDEGSRITDGDVGERGQAVGMFPPAPSLRRHSMSFEERSATNRNVSHMT